jgi:hypothetical protein
MVNFMSNYELDSKVMTLGRLARRDDERREIAEQEVDRKKRRAEAVPIPTLPKPIDQFDDIGEITTWIQTFCKTISALTNSTNRSPEPLKEVVETKRQLEAEKCKLQYRKQGLIR